MQVRELECAAAARKLEASSQDWGNAIAPGDQGGWGRASRRPWRDQAPGNALRQSSAQAIQDSLIILRTSLEPSLMTGAFW